MFARLSVFRGPPDRTAEGIRVAREQILPTARLQPGFKGIYLLHDPASGHSLSLTLWDSEEEMSSSEESARRARSESTRASGDVVDSVERFEVALSHLVE